MTTDKHYFNRYSIIAVKKNLHLQKSSSYKAPFHFTGSNYDGFVYNSNLNSN